MDTKELVSVLRKWHISGDDACLYCPQCWGRYLARFDRQGQNYVRQDSRDGNLPWARQAPFCELCGRDAREEV